MYIFLECSVPEGDKLLQRWILFHQLVRKKIAARDKVLGWYL